MEYTKCLVELDEILNYLSIEDLEKIPKEILKNIKEQKDKNYSWKYDENKKLNEQNINRKTIAMLSYLNMEYLLNDEQRKFMENMHKLNEQKLEKEKMEKYSPDNLFESRKQSQENIVTEQTSMIEYKESIFKSIINKIKKFFRKGK